MCMASRVTDQRQPGSEAATVYTRDSLRGATENTVHIHKETVLHVHSDGQYKYIYSQHRSLPNPPMNNW